MVKELESSCIPKLGLQCTWWIFFRKKHNKIKQNTLLRRSANIHHDCFTTASTDDLAYNKPAIQSSDWSTTYVADKAVDRDLSTYSCTLWKKSDPYWSVDLGMSTYIDHVYINSVDGSNGESFILMPEQKCRYFLRFVLQFPWRNLLIIN